MIGPPGEREDRDAQGDDPRAEPVVHPPVPPQPSQAPPAEAPGPPPPWPAAPPYWAPPPPQPPPGPAPGLEYAGFWIRFAAYLIDLIPLLIVSVLVLLPALSTLGAELGDLPFPEPGASRREIERWQLEYTERIARATGPLNAASGVTQLISLSYFVGFWAWRGQTPGMMALGLWIARESDGARPGLGRSILRYVGFFISSLVLFIGLIWAAFDPRKQGWHDKIAGTVVVKRAR